MELWFYERKKFHNSQRIKKTPHLSGNGSIKFSGDEFSGASSTRETLPRLHEAENCPHDLGERRRAAPGRRSAMIGGGGEHATANRRGARRRVDLWPRRSRFQMLRKKGEQKGFLWEENALGAFGLWQNEPWWNRNTVYKGSNDALNNISAKYFLFNFLILYFSKVNSPTRCVQNVLFGTKKMLCNYQASELRAKRCGRGFSIKCAAANSFCDFSFTWPAWKNHFRRQALLLFLKGKRLPEIHRELWFFKTMLPLSKPFGIGSDFSKKAGRAWKTTNSQEDLRRP